MIPAMCRGLDCMATWGPFQLYYSMILCFKVDSGTEQGVGLDGLRVPFQLYYSKILWLLL